LDQRSLGCLPPFLAGRSPRATSFKRRSLFFLVVQFLKSPLANFPPLFGPRFSKRALASLTDRSEVQVASRSQGDRLTASPPPCCSVLRGIRFLFFFCLMRVPSEYLLRPACAGLPFGKRMANFRTSSPNGYLVRSGSEFSQGVLFDSFPPLFDFLTIFLYSSSFCCCFCLPDPIPPSSHLPNRRGRLLHAFDDVRDNPARF